MEEVLELKEMKNELVVTINGVEFVAAKTKTDEVEIKLDLKKDVGNAWITFTNQENGDTVKIELKPIE